jgi:hypothetical protein
MFILKVFPGAIDVSIMLLGSTFKVVSPEANVEDEKNVIEEATIKERQITAIIFCNLVFIIILSPLLFEHYKNQMI